MSMTTDWLSASGAAITVSFGAGGPAAVTVATDRQLHAEPVGLGQKARVLSRSAPVANAAVNFIVKKSNGALVTGTATTESNRTATYKLRLTKNDPVGNYEADAAVMSASAATNFIVQ
jgi:uncharacterized protein YfaS (alpha-2-macroglobulin family)